MQRQNVLLFRGDNFSAYDRRGFMISLMTSRSTIVARDGPLRTTLAYIRTTNTHCPLLIRCGYTQPRDNVFTAPQLDLRIAIYCALRKIPIHAEIHFMIKRKPVLAPLVFINVRPRHFSKFSPTFQKNRRTKPTRRWPIADKFLSFDV